MGFLSGLARPAMAGRVPVLLLILLFSQSLAFAKDNLELVLEDAAGGRLYAAPVHNGSQFAIRYTHSVALTPVTDYFFIRDNAIWLDRTEYQDFGAGLPHTPEHGQKMRTEHGMLSISGYERKLGSFQLRVGRVANHALLLKSGKKWIEIPLNSISVPGSAITFTVSPLNHK